MSPRLFPDCIPTYYNTLGVFQLCMTVSKTPQTLTGIQHNTMASKSQVPVSQRKGGALGSYGRGGNASLLIEKSKGGLRRSTPDSEALTSSDN
jgi:hypothetical protein